jgi:hypothetical protein
MIVAVMDLKMLGKARNTFSEDRDLDLGGTGVTLMSAVLLDDCGFFFF